MKIQADKTEKDIVSNELFIQPTNISRNSTDLGQTKFNMLQHTADTTEADILATEQTSSISDQSFDKTTLEEDVDVAQYMQQLQFAPLLLNTAVELAPEFEIEKNSENLLLLNSDCTYMPPSGDLPSSAIPMLSELQSSALAVTDIHTVAPELHYINSRQITPVAGNDFNPAIAEVPNQSQLDPAAHMLTDLANEVTSDLHTQPPTTSLPSPSELNMELNNRVDTSSMNQQDVAKVFTQLAYFVNSQTMDHAHVPIIDNPSTAHPMSFNSDRQIFDSEFFQPQLTIETLRNLTETGADAYSARIRIFPPELGEITAKLKLTGDRVELIVLSQNNYVKELIEANLVSLRENFQKMDLSISQIDIFSASNNAATDQFHQQKQQQLNQDVLANSLDMQKSTSNTIAKQSIDHMSLIDTYA